MTDQLFKDESVNPQATPEPTPAPTENTTDLFTDQLAAIKNESGEPKYDSVEKAIEALQHSQQYIPELKDKVSTQEQLILDLQAKLEAKETVQEIVNKQTPPVEETPTSATSLSEQDVATLVAQELAKSKAQATEATNQSTVSQALSEKYGTNAQAEIAQKAASLGMKPSELGALSKTNPAMVLALFGEKQTGSVNPSTGSIRIPAGNPPQEELKSPSKSLLSGSTSREQAEFMKKVKEEIYRKYDVTS